MAIADVAQDTKAPAPSTSTPRGRVHTTQSQHTFTSLAVPLHFQFPPTKNLRPAAAEVVDNPRTAPVDAEAADAAVRAMAENMV